MCSIDTSRADAAWSQSNKCFDGSGQTYTNRFQAHLCGFQTKCCSAVQSSDAKRQSRMARVSRLAVKEATYCKALTFLIHWSSFSSFNHFLSTPLSINRVLKLQHPLSCLLGYSLCFILGRPCYILI